MKLKKLTVRKKSVSPNLDDFADDEVCSVDEKGIPIQRNTANARERARMRVLSSAFYRLKTIIPWVPHDTKLSKLDTLRLARNYIAYLTATLEGQPVNEITNKMPHPQKMTWPYIFQQVPDLVPDLNANKISIAACKETDNRKLNCAHLTSDSLQKFSPYDEDSHNFSQYSEFNSRFHKDFEMQYE